VLVLVLVLVLALALALASAGAAPNALVGAKRKAKQRGSANAR
jgi:hypothetical protein